VATTVPCEQDGANPHPLVRSTQLEADPNDLATAAGGLPAGAPAAVHYGGGAGDARGSGGAAWYEEHDGAVGSGGGRLETRNRGAAGARPWRTSMAVDHARPQVLPARLRLAGEIGGGRGRPRGG
jgi:hypothetical protein